MKKASPCKRGGSLASDAVTSAVDPAAFAQLNASQTNIIEGGCAKCGGKKTKKVVKACTNCGKGGKAKNVVPATKATKNVVKGKKGGSANVPAYNYNGLLYDQPLSNSTNNPSAAVPLPARTSGGSLKKIGELGNSMRYNLYNRVGGADPSVKTFPIGIDYKPAIVGTQTPFGNSPRLTNTGISQISGLADTTFSSVPAPISKVAMFGNNITDGVPPAFSYGVGTNGGGLVKKLIVAAIAKEVIKKAAKAYKKKKEDKKLEKPSAASKKSWSKK